MVVRRGVFLLVVVLICFINVVAQVGSPFDGDDWKPTQVHIALAGKDTEGNSNTMSISWNTKLKTDTSVVKYGLASNKLDLVSTGSSSSYYITYNHHVTLGELKPDTVYYYTVGDDDKSSWSEIKSFRTSPLSSDLRENWTFAYFADLGVVNGAPTTDYVGTMVSDSTEGEQDGVRLVWHGGDVGYADDSFLHWGCYARFCYEDTFDTYMDSASDKWAAQVPYMVMPGNHEADCHSPACLVSKKRRELLSNFTAFNERFHMPSKEVNGSLNMHYSFNYGNVHFISMDTETGFPDAPLEKRYVLPCGGFADQMTWIEEDLRIANLPENRAKQPWILVAGHRPMYDGNEINIAFQTALEDVFYKYGVDVYFAGHRHYYSRNYPVYDGIVDTNQYDYPKATSYITAGGSGNDEMTDIQRKLAQEVDDSARVAAGEAGEPGVDKPIDVSPEDRSMSIYPGLEGHSDGPWTAKNDFDNHVGATLITIINDHELRMDYIRTKTGEVYDTMTLKRDHSAGNFPQDLPSKR